MTFTYKCPVCLNVSAQADQNGTECFYCRAYKSMPEHLLDIIADHVKPDSVIADVGCMNCRLSFYLDTSLVSYRYLYCIDARSARFNRSCTKYIQCNTLCEHDVKNAFSEMSPVDILILDAHDDYDGARNEFYNFCGIVRIGGKIFLHGQDNDSFWNFIAELTEWRIVESFDNLVMVHWE